MPINRISIAMCTYNGERFLLQQLDSILTQTVLPNELIVCDDGSNDQTMPILREFAFSAPFMVKLFSNNQKSLGSTKNFEKAIGLCTGEIIVLCDQDDVWLPGKLAVLQQAIINGAGLVFSNAEIVNEKLEPFGYTLFDSLDLNKKEKYEMSNGLIFDILMRRNIVTGATLAFSHKHLSLVLPISNNWVHDGWIALLIATVDKVVVIKEPLIEYRQHRKNQIGAKKLDLSAKLKLTNKLGNRHYLKLFKGFEDVKIRLNFFATEKLNINYSRNINAKIAHVKVRSNLTNKNFSALFGLLKELLQGRYHYFSRGWISFFRDISMIVKKIDQ